MDVSRAGDAGDVQAFASPVGAVPRWLLLVYGLNGLGALVHVVFDPEAIWVVLLALWAALIATYVVGRHREKRRPAELVLTPREVIKRPAFGRTRSTPWSEVQNLYVDPPGGSRYVTVTLRDRRSLRLLAVRDEDVPAVKARWESIRAARSAPGVM